MAGNYAMKVPTCDGFRIPAHRTRIHLNGLMISEVVQICKDARYIRHQCLRHAAVDRVVGVKPNESKRRKTAAHPGLGILKKNESGSAIQQNRQLPVQWQAN